MNNNTRDGAQWEGSRLLASLRAVIPRRKLQLHEALRIAELQANRLLELSDVREAPVPSAIVASLPRILIDYDIDMPFSGTSNWDAHRRAWVITLNALEPDTRHRFSLLHEYKHIVDHGRSDLIYTGSARQTADAQAEQVADYFAACVLMPKRLVKRAWGEGIQRKSDLAALFDVSPRAIDVRLAQLGLTEPRSRCAPARTSARRSEATTPRSLYRRSLPASWPTRSVQPEVAA